MRRILLLVALVAGCSDGGDTSAMDTGDAGGTAGLSECGFALACFSLCEQEFRDLDACSIGDDCTAHTDSLEACVAATCSEYYASWPYEYWDGFSPTESAFYLSQRCEFTSDPAGDCDQVEQMCSDDTCTQSSCD